jgi:flagellar biosynthesis chaperone FliJ
MLKQYDSIVLDDKKLVPAKVKLLLSKPNMVEMVLTKLILQSLLHLHINKKTPNDISRKDLQANKAMLIMIVDLINRKGYSKQDVGYGIIEIKDMIDKINDADKSNYSDRSDEKKLSGFSNSELAMKMLLSDMGNCVQQQSPSVALRECIEEKDRLVNRINNLRDDLERARAQPNVLLRLTEDTKAKEQLAILRQAYNELEQRARNMTPADCTSYINSVGRLQSELGSCRGELRECESTLNDTLQQATSQISAYNSNALPTAY